MTAGFFITGTDTGVGKTHATAALLRGWAAQGMRAVGMKPVACGAAMHEGRIFWEDVDCLQAAGNVDAPLALRNPYRFEAPVAPHVAAQAAGCRLEIGVIRTAYDALAAQADVVAVEGAGGWYVPLDERHTLADVPRALRLRVILVVGMRLGCINHALLTGRAIRGDGLELAGWIANCVDPGMAAFADNLQAIRERLDVPLLGVLPWRDDSAAETLHFVIQAPSGM